VAAKPADGGPRGRPRARTSTVALNAEIASTFTVGDQAQQKNGTATPPSPSRTPAN
jgi:hypothetical protein